MTNVNSICIDKTSAQERKCGKWSVILIVAILFMIMGCSGNAKIIGEPFEIESDQGDFKVEVLDEGIRLSTRHLGIRLINDSAVDLQTNYQLRIYKVGFNHYDLDIVFGPYGKTLEKKTVKSGEIQPNRYVKYEHWVQLVLPAYHEHTFYLKTELLKQDVLQGVDARWRS